MAATFLYFVPLGSLTVSEGSDAAGNSTGALFPGDQALGDVGNAMAVRGEGGTPARLTLTDEAQTLRVRDDDARFNDDLGINQDTNSPFPQANQTVIGGSAGVEAGSLVQLQYSYALRGSDGSSLRIHAVNIRPPDALEDADNTIAGIVATAPLKPGVTYRVTGVFDDLRPTYASLVPCFVAGTMIATPQGEIAVEALRPGDAVLTRDHGARPVRWIGARHLGPEVLAAQPHFRPIRIRAGALGDAPLVDLVVSPQHRVLVRSRIALRMFGAMEVLVAAKQLLGVEGIEVAGDLRDVTYVHFAFDRHEVVLSNGAATESLYPGAEALKAVGPAAREELLAIFPQLRGMQVPPARILADGRQARALAQRHQRNARPLVG